MADVAAAAKVSLMGAGCSSMPYVCVCKRTRGCTQPTCGVSTTVSLPSHSTSASPLNQRTCALFWLQDALRKCEAMPAFKPGAAAGGLLDSQALLARQPLEPALAALR